MNADHITLMTASDVAGLCHDFSTHYKVPHFLHTRMYFDGSRFALTNNPEWYQYFIENHLFNYSRLDKHPSCYRSGYFLWDAWNKGTLYDYLKEFEAGFDYGHGFSIIRRHHEWVDKFDFATYLHHRFMNQFYINNLSLFNQFVDAYCKEAKNIFLIAEKKREILPYTPKAHYDKEYKDTFLPRNILSALNLDNDTNNVKLTKRELECAYWLVNGKTISEIGMLLEISPKTVEKFFDSIKKKFNAYTLFQLGMKISTAGLTILLSDNLA